MDNLIKFHIFFDDLTQEKKDYVVNLVKEELKKDEELMAQYRGEADEKAKQLDPTAPYEMLLDEILTERALYFINCNFYAEAEF